jgi:hypothetical protein
MSELLEVFHKCYLNRLNWLNSELEKRDSQLIVQQLRLAQINTQVSSLIFQDLFGAAASITKHLKEEKKRMEEECKNLESNIRKMEESLLLIDDQESKEFQVMTIQHCRSSLDNMRHLQATLLGFYAFFIGLNLEIVMKNLSDIYNMNDADKIYNAMQELIEYLLGLSPPGWLISGLFAIRNIINVSEKEAKSADTYIGALEVFNFSISQWCLIVQLLVDSISGIKSQELPSIEDASTKVQDRFSSFFDKLDEKRDNIN